MFSGGGLLDCPRTRDARSPTEDTLLLVDPDLDFLDWATKHLAAKNLRILRCDNAANAIKVVEKTPSAWWWRPWNWSPSMAWSC